VQLYPHWPALHVAEPTPPSTVGHALMHVPQCCGSVWRLVHVPPQLVGRPLSALQPLPQTPAEQVAWTPASQTLVQLPQCCGEVGLTQVPLQFSDVGVVQPASAGPSVPPSPWPPSPPLLPLLLPAS
jgi:hypothetical protein